MAKKKENNKEEPKEEIPMVEEKYILAELVESSTEDMSWIIYNLSRKGLLQQYEQEIADYGTKEIKPTLTVEEFNKIITGEK